MLNMPTQLYYKTISLRLRQSFKIMTGGGDSRGIYISYNSTIFTPGWKIIYPPRRGDLSIFSFFIFFDLPYFFSPNYHRTDGNWSCYPPPPASAYNILREYIPLEGYT